MEILVDASAIMAVIVEEPNKEKVINLTKNAIVLSPNMITYEIANGLTKMMKRKIIGKENMVILYKYFKKINIKFIEIDIEKALEIAMEYNIYAYDACYLESANRLKLPLLTFDTGMQNIGKAMGINILGG
jgi:predicted nucleic acid-binding protein